MAAVEQAAVEQPGVEPRANRGEIVEVDGAMLTVRALHAGDAFSLLRMFDRLSPESIYHRFFSPIPRPRCAGISPISIRRTSFPCR